MSWRPGARRNERMEWKPRIFKIAGTWACMSHDASGIGSCPAEAYQDWVRGAIIQRAMRVAA